MQEVGSFVPNRNAAWLCLVCGEPIDSEAGVLGVSLTDDVEEHLCPECWEKITPVDRLEIIRRWRLDRQAIRTLKALERLCDGARDGFHLPGSGEAGQN